MNVNNMTLGEIKAHLRKEYKFFECPKKSDRLEIPENVWQQIDWTQEEMTRNIALPHKMWNMRHDDHIWPWCKKFRGEDAYGYRAGEGHPKYMPELPKLVEGRGISRWISLHDLSRVEVPKFNDYGNKWTINNMPEIIEFYERNPKNPNYGKDLLKYQKKNFLAIYAPSSLQKFSKRSYLLRDPHHISWHYMIKKREQIGVSKDKTGPDTVAFHRRGNRWDSIDGYMIKGAWYSGLRWN